tara:strand:+ start:489 stop:632 length:144 start_codon:yes stop_codon:yes gene_type:complete
MKNWALLENGLIHTDGLTKEEAIEMEERHSFFFENLTYTIGLTKDWS